jgi:hypothetical protein
LCLVYAGDIIEGYSTRSLLSNACISVAVVAAASIFAETTPNSTRAVVFEPPHAALSTADSLHKAVLSTHYTSSIV